jgi:chaperone modulatory protein CbpM
MDDSEFCSHLGVEVTIVEFWITEGWLRPQISGGRRAFRQADAARGRLILDLVERMGVNEAGVDVVMDLIDQIHGLRDAMAAVKAAIETQDEETRARIIDSLGRS